MSEFDIHNDVNQLMKLLEIEENIAEGVTADELTDVLAKSVEQRSKTRGAKDTFLRTLEIKSDPDFRNKYEDLKIHNVLELDPLVHLLARINDDKKIKYLLNMQNKISTKKQNNRQPVDQLDGISPLSNRVTTTASASSTIDRHSFHSAATHRLSTTDINCTPNIDEDFMDRRSVYTKSPKDMSAKKKEDPIRPLNSLSVAEQESALIEDLLFVLIGIEGRYIRLQQLRDKPNKHDIVVDKGGDELLYTLAQRIIALCPYFSQINHFIDTIDNGLVNQALVAAMRAQIKDFFTLISQLETQHRKSDLTLQKMWYYLQPSFTNLAILKDIASKVVKSNSIGGAVLSILHEKTISMTGNTKAQEFCLLLTRKASEPYFEILDTWIYEGIIDDPYKEFLVEDRANESDDIILDDLFWESRYEVIRSRIPVFFERHTDMIMKTGKYLSVIRNCGRKISRPQPPEHLCYTTEERIYIESIESAYKFASKELLHLLVDESDLMGRLKSIKHYFFMDFGDFIVQFMDLAGDELEKDVNDIALNRLHSLLELALRTSLMNSDPYKDDVRIELLSDSLHTQMSEILNIGTNSPNFEITEPYTLKGAEALTLDFQVSWPLSLIISRKNITCYQMLFRHLFYCKYVERQLEEVWKNNKIAKRFTFNAVIGYGKAFCLRQKMLNFVQNLEYYIMLEVIEPTFHQFLEYVQTKVSSVDDMMKSHEDYIQKCLRDAMLTSGELLKAIVQLLRLCIVFSNFMKDSQSHSTQYELLDSSQVLDKEFKRINEEDENVSDTKSLQNSFEDHISLMQSEFDAVLHQLLQAIKLKTQESYTMIPVLNRLDFNGFYQSLEARNDL
ncbi:gamma-tubulin complex component 2-like isoform X2 [Oppia nitens]|uniref:gamma-tubulin complex component 2-like isoform X2 n=1 Tax=Oppia nitens TaxID=1686743 RepID=UPI0023DC832C|nr:gamma-tubulin complex component 2-like isoform X2 [Oppia nitens]